MVDSVDGTTKVLEEFLTWAGDKGELNPSTASALRSTAGKVFEVADDPDALDVTEFDVEALLGRWENLNRINYSPGSMQTYKSRFRQAVAMYRAWLVNDSGWKSAGKSSPATGTKATNKQGRPRKAQSKSTTTTPTPEPEENLSPQPGVRLVAYDLPLRPDMLVRLTLPIDLTNADAARISAFVSSLAFAAEATNN